MTHRRRSSVALLAALLVVAACQDMTAPPTRLAPAGALRQGGSGGGGGTAVSAAGVLPTTPPAPDVLIRESFGPGPDMIRPAGGKGAAKTTYVHTTINGFWVEYPGNSKSAWIAPEVGQTWKFCGGGDNTSTENPWEIPSPLQTLQAGCVASEWIDPPTSYPTALMPINVALPSGGYELSMEGYPAPIAGGYIAIGFTNSGALTSNLTTSGTIWLKVTDSTHFGVPLHYELRAGSLASGQLIASGDGGSTGWNHMGVRVSPDAGTITLTFADQVIGTFPFIMAPPKYLAFEGIGILDDVVLRQ